MGKVWKKGAAALLAAVMCASALSGCGKKSEAISAFSFNGKKVDGDLANFVLRFEEASLDDMYAYYASMMQQDIWSMDDGQGLGITTWDNFKNNVAEDIEKLLLAEEHAEDYSVSLTDEEKQAITDAATKFMESNDKDALASMSATQEVVERYLTLSTIKGKVEAAMCADVDTNVSDEEAAQKTVGYIKYTPSTEPATEAQSESELAQTEADAANTVETEADAAAVAETEADTAAVAETEADTAAMTEGETSVVETEPAEKTKSADETEEVSTEAVSTEAVSTEAEPAAAESEVESETEDPAMAEARVKYREMAEEELAALMSGEIDFETATSQVEEESVTGVTASTFTFGKDDDYPDAAIIEATNDLEDGALVEEIIEAEDSYYILHMDDAFDEEATEDKKKEIVEERKSEKINEVYEEWMADADFKIDSEVLNALVKERNYTAPVSDETENVEAEEAATEAMTEADAQAGTAAETEADAGAAVQTEAQGTAAAETEADAGAAETEA